MRQTVFNGAFSMNRPKLQQSFFINMAHFSNTCCAEARQPPAFGPLSMRGAGFVFLGTQRQPFPFYLFTTGRKLAISSKFCAG
jgi:hypothetical protein